MEVSPAIIGAALLVFTYNSFRLTTLVYSLKDIFGFTRNNYDKAGHFVQGFVPALIAREIILRKNIIQGAAWQYFFIISFCLGFSAFYELIEWWVALLSEEAAEAFLGWALLGAVTSLICLSHFHDRQLRKLRL